MTRLSVNVNKIATIRNSRGGNNPDLLKMALWIEELGAQGITVHPRPDERHIHYQDVYNLKKSIQTEFNIEGNCREESFIKLVLANQPDQVTLVPDDPNQLTSNHGWDTIKHKNYLQEVCAMFQEKGIRVSIFVDPNPEFIEGAKETGTDRIELYTESYALMYPENKELAIKPFVECAKIAKELNLGLNAGHDLDLNNLAYFTENIPNLLEVSIGHALICDALTYGMSETISKYLKEIQTGIHNRA